MCAFKSQGLVFSNEIYNVPAAQGVLKMVAISLAPDSRLGSRLVLGSAQLKLLAKKLGSAREHFQKSSDMRNLKKNEPISK